MYNPEFYVDVIAHRCLKLSYGLGDLRKMAPEVMCYRFLIRVQVNGDRLKIDKK